MNLYGFVGNRGTNVIDFLGLLGNENSVVIHVSYQWWSSWKGPSGGDQLVGHADPYLFTLSADASATCNCGHPEFTLPERQDVSTARWWGAATGDIAFDTKASSGNKGSEAVFIVDSKAKTASTLAHAAIESVGSGVVGGSLPGGNTKVGGAGWGALVGAALGAFHSYAVEGEGAIRHFVTVTCNDWKTGDPVFSKPVSVKFDLSESSFGAGSRWLSKNYVRHAWLSYE